MGYSTDFSGSFKLDKKLDKETQDLLEGLNTTRRMKRDLKGFGVEGEFYVGSRNDFGQDRTPDVVDYNSPPRTQPGLWCGWTPTGDGLAIEWDGGEKFYDYVEWIEYLIDSVLAPRGYALNGEVEWFGEDRSDMGKIVIVNNKVSTKTAQVSYR